MYEIWIFRERLAQLRQAEESGALAGPSLQKRFDDDQPSQDRAEVVDLRIFGA